MAIQITIPLTKGKDGKGFNTVKSYVDVRVLRVS